MIITLLNLELSYFILRATLGVFFITHGYQKLFCNFRGTKEFLSALRFRPAGLWAAVLGAIEFLGGGLIFLGLWTQVAAGFLALVMLIALAKVKFGKEKFVGGWELEWLAFGIALALVFGLSGEIFFGFFNG